MIDFPEGRAVVYCEGMFTTSNGKTAHGLVRRTRRYQVLSVVDSTQAGQDAGRVLDGRHRGIPIVRDLGSAVAAAKAARTPATHFVIGLAPDGGRIPTEARRAILEAIDLGLNVDSGLHDFITEDREIAERATRRGVRLRDVRKTPPRGELHFFCGKIQEVASFKVAALGTDSAVGKRTTAWEIVSHLEESGYTAEMVGTGQTAFMQGVRYGIILDSLINDFVSGEIEHAVWSAWHEARPDFIVLEGQGSLLNPAYPGGYELLAAGRPDVVVLQHAPGRREYDGFPGWPIHPLDHQIRAIELVSGKPVVAITINHENIPEREVPELCERIRRETGLPACDPILDGVEEVVRALLAHSTGRVGASRVGAGCTDAGPPGASCLGATRVGLPRAGSPRVGQQGAG
ncbi:MAG: DUF1611 domain-containing protein [Planctomycetota bacterium]